MNQSNNHRNILKISSTVVHEAASKVSPGTVATRLADIVPLLVHASQTKRGWLNDFADDVVHVPQDLYEVLLAYQELVVRKAA